MKRSIVSIALTALLLTGCSSGSTGATAKYKAGTYTGTGDGKNGEVVVEVVVSDSAITSVTVKEHSETDGIADPALEQLPEAIVKAGSAEVESVSGATVTSEAIKTAVNDALSKAKN